jgi:hypothetical protein
VKKLLLVAAAVALLAAPTALADIGTVPNDGSLPWASGADTSPLEALAGQIASTISGRSVSVRCEGDYDWGLLAAQHNVDPAAELGYVPFWIHTLNGVAIGAPFADTYTEISPLVCAHLNDFAVAATKPTKCSVTSDVAQYTTRTVRTKVTIAKRVRVKVRGRFVFRTKRSTRWVSKQVVDTTYVQVTDPPAPCYLGDENQLAPQSDAYWSEYFWYARSMLTLAHESIHLRGDMSEVDASCYGLQWVDYVAQQLGATPDDAAAIASYDADYAYPLYKNVPGYWSADCHDGGALDLHPDSSIWP